MLSIQAKAEKLRQNCSILEKNVLNIHCPLKNLFTGCGCSAEGSVSQTCQQNGQCQCKENYTGTKCDSCRYGFYDYPRCIKCACDVRGSKHEICDLKTGQCTCKGSFRGLNCNQCRSGYYGFPSCKACQCNPYGIKPIDGRPFGDCSYSNNVSILRIM